MRRRPQTAARNDCPLCRGSGQWTYAAARPAPVAAWATPGEPPAAVAAAPLELRRAECPRCRGVRFCPLCRYPIRPVIVGTNVRRAGDRLEVETYAVDTCDCCDALETLRREIFGER